MNNIISKLFKYQRDKQSVENNLKNGRVDITGKYDSVNMPLFNEKNNGIGANNTYTLSHIYDETEEQKMFFSGKNIENLQNLIIYHVWIQSQNRYRIGKQDPNQLLIIMKSIYLQYGSNTEKNLLAQIKRLNAFVLDYSVKNILSNIEQYRYYKKTVSKIAKPMELPKYISSAGTRTNPNFIF